MRAPNNDTAAIGSGVLSDLIARLEAATGPDRELDFAVRQDADPGFHSWHRWALREAALYRDGWHEKCGRKILGPVLLRTRKREALSLYRRYADESTPPYTSSLDAALTLVPGGEWWCLQAMLGGRYQALVSLDCPAEQIEGFGKNPALALCISALKARAAAEGRS